MLNSTSALAEYLQNTPGPWTIQFCVGEHGVPINETNFGHMKFIVDHYELDHLSGRITFKGNGGYCSVILSELYLDKVVPEKDAIVFLYNYAWAITSENLEDCPVWMLSIEKTLFTQNITIIHPAMEVVTD